MTHRQRRSRQLRVVETVTSPVLVGSGTGALVDEVPADDAGMDHHRPEGRSVAWVVPDRVGADLAVIRQAIGLRARGVVRATTDGLGSVTPHEAVAYGGLGVLALLGAVEAPVIAVLAGLAWMTRPTMPPER